MRMLLVLVTWSIGAQAAIKDLPCHDGSCLRREDKSHHWTPGTSTLQNDAKYTIRQWHTLQNWGGVKTRGSDEEFNDDMGGGTWAPLSMQNFDVRSFWESNRAECAAILMILIILVLYVSVKSAFSSATDWSQPTVPLSTAGVFVKGLVICIPCP